MTASALRGSTLGVAEGNKGSGRVGKESLSGHGPCQLVSMLHISHTPALPVNMGLLQNSWFLLYHFFGCWGMQHAIQTISQTGRLATISLQGCPTDRQPFLCVGCAIATAGSAEWSPCRRSSLLHQTESHSMVWELYRGDRRPMSTDYWSSAKAMCDLVKSPTRTGHSEIL